MDLSTDSEIILITAGSEKDAEGVGEGRKVGAFKAVVREEEESVVESATVAEVCDFLDE